MRNDLIPPATGRSWQIFAAGCVAAFLLALALSVAPQLHHQIHGAQGPEHACVVTLIAAGGCDHFAAAAPSGVPAATAPQTTLPASEGTTPVALFESSILEHAPPRLA